MPNLVALGPRATLVHSTPTGGAAMTRHTGTVDGSNMGTILVYGAYGHTARFIVNEFGARRFKLVLAGETPIQ
jgi:hypothetical protein